MQPARPALRRRGFYVCGLSCCAGGRRCSRTRPRLAASHLLQRGRPCIVQTWGSARDEGRAPNEGHARRPARQSREGRVAWEPSGCDASALTRRQVFASSRSKMGPSVLTRRIRLERRIGKDRRLAARRAGNSAVERILLAIRGERRSGNDRRSGEDRRALPPPGIRVRRR
jgi:hypothetical protein